METLGNTLEIKTSKLRNINFVCEVCIYKCSKKFNYDRHILSARHLLEINRKQKRAKNEQNEQIKEFICDACDKIYQTNAGLWKHKKLCNNDKIQYTNKLQKNDITDKELIMTIVKQNAELMKENSEMKHMMLKVIENGTNNTNTNTNSHNKTFNLQFFLNETCKNALNIDEFVSSIKVSLTELENTGRRGYIEGISSIILHKLNMLKHCDRPIHCSDNKRETIYIKNENQWIKECEEKPILTKAIKTIANENIKQINVWKENNPECTEADSNKNNLYLQIVSNSMSGSTKEESDKNINKIISNVAVKTSINK